MYSIEEERICRLCRRSKDTILSYIFAQGNHYIVEEIEFLVQQKPSKNDCLPPYICHRCVYKIKSHKEFRNMCMETLNVFQEKIMPEKDDDIIVLKEDLYLPVRDRNAMSGVQHTEYSQSQQQQGMPHKMQKAVRNSLEISKNIDLPVMQNRSQSPQYARVYRNHNLQLGPSSDPCLEHQESVFTNQNNINLASEYSSQHRGSQNYFWEPVNETALENMVPSEFYHTAVLSNDKDIQLQRQGWSDCTTKNRKLQHGLLSVHTSCIRSSSPESIPEIIEVNKGTVGYVATDRRPMIGSNDTSQSHQKRQTTEMPSVYYVPSQQLLGTRSTEKPKSSVVQSMHTRRPISSRAQQRKPVSLKMFKARKVIHSSFSDTASIINHPRASTSSTYVPVSFPNSDSSEVVSPHTKTAAIGNRGHALLLSGSISEPSCQMCGVMFNNVRELRVHVDSEHNCKNDRNLEYY